MRGPLDATEEPLARPLKLSHLVYGFPRNRVTIRAFLNYAHEQGLLWRKLAPEGMCLDESA